MQLLFVFSISVDEAVCPAGGAFTYSQQASGQRTGSSKDTQTHGFREIIGDFTTFISCSGMCVHGRVYGYPKVPSSLLLSLWTLRSVQRMPAWLFEPYPNSFRIRHTAHLLICANQTYHLLGLPHRYANFSKTDGTKSALIA